MEGWSGAVRPQERAQSGRPLTRRSLAAQTPAVHLRGEVSSCRCLQVGDGGGLLSEILQRFLGVLGVATSLLVHSDGT